MTAEQIADTPTVAATTSRTFFGEPRALAYLAFTEAWERFSFYGMTALLPLYLTQSLLLGGHVEHIAGFHQFRAALESLFGQLTPIALASQIVGLYTAFIYFTPVFGGMAADRWLGQRRAVLLGATLMSAGHIAMAFDASFLLALLLLITGCGLLKGNISTQVGALYPEGESEARTRAFTIFSMGINVGAVAGPLLCGLAAQIYGWHIGFGLAGLLMLTALATYTAGYRYLPAGRRKRESKRVPIGLDRGEWQTVLAIAIMTGITVFQTIAYYQNTNINLIWIDQAVDMDVLGFHVPVAWFASLDPLVSIVAVPLLLTLWRGQAARGTEPDDLGKIGWGAWIAAAANIFLAVACLGSGRTSIVAPFVYDTLLGIAFLYYWPPFLGFVSRTAPLQVRATLMGALFLSLFLGDFMVGWLGGFYERMTPAAFWAMHAAIAATGGILALLFKRPLAALTNTGNSSRR
jgi:POT family proton-dependent oligopeptide transporter